MGMAVNFVSFNLDRGMTKSRSMIRTVSGLEKADMFVTYDVWGQL